MTAEPSHEEMKKKIRDLELEVERYKRNEREFHLQAQILSSIKDSVVIITPEMKTIYANETIKEIFGDRPEMFTEPCYRFFKNRERVCPDCPVLKTIRDKKPHKAIMKSYDKNGEEMWRLNTAFPFYDRDGKVIAGIEVVTDYTQQKRNEIALKESEKHYRNLFENALVGMWVSRVEDGKFISSNQKNAEIVGFESVEDLVKNCTTAEFYSPKRRAQLLALLNKDGKVSDFEAEFTLKDGTRKDVSICAKLFPEKGQIEGVIIDITDRKQAEEALRESERKYRDIFESAPVGMFQSTPSGRYISVNQEFARTLGFDDPEALIQAVSDIADLYVDPRDRDEFKRLLQERGSIGGHEIHVKNRVHGTSWMSIYTRAVRDEKGNVKFYDGFTIDITERKQMKEALEKSESNLQSVFDAVPVGICLMKDRVYRRANRNWRESFGYTEESLIGRTTEFLYESKKEYERVGKDLYGNILVDGIASVKSRLKRSDGEFRDVVLIAKPIDHQDLSAGTVVVVHDVTERNRIEEERKRLEDQLRQSQKMEAIGTLAGGLAHDFNNLLMAIQGRASIMLMDKDSSNPDFEHLKGIESYIASAADLTKQLLGFARGGKYEVKPTDLNDLIKKESRLFGRTKKEIVIREKYGDHLWPVEVDRVQIQQVLLNLFVNAWQAMPTGGDLYIRTQNVTIDENYVKPYQVTPGRYVQISITDTGIGMDRTTRQKIFDPFFTTKDLSRGTGLGLASAYGIIKNHGGFINVYSEKGHGSTFNIYVPASLKAVVKEEKRGEGTIKGSETILFVDDERMITEVANDLLEILGYNVMVAESGKEAVEIYAENRDVINAVILDMIMPDMGGGDTYDRLKELNPEVKVLLSSGYSINGQATEILDRGCNGFIQKPFKVNELSKKLREILDGE